MALATQGSVIKPKYQNSLLNSLQPPNKTSFSTPPPQTNSGFVGPVKPPAPPVAGNVVGVLNQPVKKDAQGNEYSAPKSNPSVLAQQQALNKQFNAGLVEDGLTGPKTREAIAKYGSGASSSTPAPLAPYVPPAGAQYPGGGSAANPDPNSSATQNTTASTTPQVGTTAENAQGVLNSGQLTPQERQALDRLTELSNGASPEYLAAMAEAQRIQDQSGQYAQDYAQKTNNIAGTAGFLTQQTGNQGLLNNQYNTVQGNLANQYAGAVGRLGAANSQQGLQQGAASSALGGAQNQAGRATGTAGTVFQGSLNTPTIPAQATFNPISGYQAGSVNGSGVNINQFGDPNDPATQANYQSYIKAVGDNNLIGVASTTFNQNFDKAISDAQQVNSILTPEQRKTPIESLMQLISNGVFGTSPVLSGLVNDIAAIKNSYKQATGNDLVIPPTATLDQLSSIRSSAQSAIKAAQAGNQELIDKYSNKENSSTSDVSGANPWH